MKKTGLIALAVVLALGAMGVGLAFWNETLTITGTVATGQLDVEFSDQKSNDDGSVDNALDPSECGTWTMSDLNSSTGWSNNAAREAYDVASTTCELIAVADANSPENGDNQTLKITILNAYPCYYGNVAFTIDNIGTIPAKIESIKLVAVSDAVGSPIVVDVDLVACTTYYVYADTGVVSKLTLGFPTTGADFSIHLSKLLVGQEIAVGGAIPGDICVHIEDGAEELANYDFSIEIVVTQFNAS